MPSGEMLFLQTNKDFRSCSNLGFRILISINQSLFTKKMASLIKLAAPLAALGLAELALATAPVCPVGPRAPLSCHNTTAIANTCCTEVQGQVVQVQFWDTQPATGPADHWTIHGLWPDYCDGTYTQYCDENRQYTNISCILEAAGRNDLLSFMEKYWKDQSGADESFWEHEWNKHGKSTPNSISPDRDSDN